MSVLKIPTKPIDGQKPGTSGLRKKTPVFMQPHYLENFVQAIWNGTGGAQGKTYVLGGDGRQGGGHGALLPGGGGVEIEVFQQFVQTDTGMGAAREMVDVGGGGAEAFRRP